MFLKRKDVGKEQWLMLSKCKWVARKEKAGLALLCAGGQTCAVGVFPSRWSGARHRWHAEHWAEVRMLTKSRGGYHLIMFTLLDLTSFGFFETSYLLYAHRGLWIRNLVWIEESVINSTKLKTVDVIMSRLVGCSSVPLVLQSLLLLHTLSALSREINQTNVKECRS